MIQNRQCGGVGKLHVKSKILSFDVMYCLCIDPIYLSIFNSCIWRYALPAESKTLLFLEIESNVPAKVATAWTWLTLIADINIKHENTVVDEVLRCVTAEALSFPLQNWPASVPYITAVYYDKILQLLPQGVCCLTQIHPNTFSTNDLHSLTSGPERDTIII